MTITINGRTGDYVDPTHTHVTTVWLPIRTVSGANTREHFRVKAKRVKAERASTAVVLACSAMPVGRVTRVDFTRVSTGELDTDNLSSAFKAIRDEVAKHLGVSDAPSGGIDWVCHQMKGAPKQHGVRVDIHTTTKEAP